MKPVSVDELEASIWILKRLFGGETVEIGGRKVKCLFPCGEVPIYIGTRSPQVMKMACGLTSGFIHAGESTSLKGLVQRIRGCTRDANRETGEVQFIYRLPCAISDDVAQAKEAVKGIVARTAMTQLGRLYDRNQLADPEDQRAIDRMRREYDTYRHMDAAHSHLVRQEWVERFALAGTAEQVRDKVRGFIAAGIDELTIVPCGPSRRALIETFAKEVMSKL